MVVDGNTVGTGHHDNGVRFIGAHSRESEVSSASTKSPTLPISSRKMSLINMFESPNNDKEIDGSQREKPKPRKGYHHMIDKNDSTTKINSIDKSKSTSIRISSKSATGNYSVVLLGNNPSTCVEKHPMTRIESNHFHDDEIRKNLIPGPSIGKKRRSTTEENNNRRLPKSSKRDDTDFNNKIKAIEENLLITCQSKIVFTDASFEKSSWTRLNTDIQAAVRQDIEYILKIPKLFPKKINALEKNQKPIDRNKQNQKLQICFYGNEEERQLNIKKQNLRYSKATDFLQYPKALDFIRITDIERNLITYPSDLGKTLKNFSHRNEFRITSMLINCNHIRNTRMYKLAYGVVPNKYKRVVKYFISYFTKELNNKAARKEGTTLNDVPIFEDGELEIMIYLYWRLESTDLLNWDPSKKYTKLKNLLLYCVHEMYKDYKKKSDEHNKCSCRNDRTKECGQRRKLNDFKVHLESINTTMGHKNSFITGHCLFALKESVQTIFALSNSTVIKVWAYFFKSCNIHHYMFPHTILAIYEQITQVASTLKIDEASENNNPKKSILARLLDHSKEHTSTKKSLIDNRMVETMFAKWLKRPISDHLLTKLAISIDNHIFCIIKSFTMGFSQKMVRDRMTQDDVVQFLSPHLTYFEGERIPFPSTKDFMNNLKKLILILLDHDRTKVNENINIWDDAIRSLVIVISLTISRALSSRFVHYQNNSVRYTDKMFVENVVYDLQNYINNVSSDHSKINSWSFMHFDDNDRANSQREDNHTSDDEVLILESSAQSSQPKLPEEHPPHSKRKSVDHDEIRILETPSPRKITKLNSYISKFFYHSPTKETMTREWCALCMEAQASKTIFFDTKKLFVCKKCIDSMNKSAHSYERFIRLVLLRLKDDSWEGYPLLFQIVHDGNISRRKIIDDAEKGKIKRSNKKRTVLEKYENPLFESLSHSLYSTISLY